MALSSISISFKNAKYPSITKDFLFGSVGDVVTATIEFTAASASELVRFKFGFIRNSDSLYPLNVTTPANYTQPASYFQSVYSGDTVGFAGAVGTLNPISPKRWQLGDGVVLTNPSGNDYVLEHTFVIPFLIRSTDIDGNLNYTKPQQLQGNESIRYVWELSSFSDSLDPSTEETTRGTDISTFVKSGNVGGFDEFLNGSAPNFELQTATIATNSAAPRTITAVIKNNLGNWNTSQKVIVCAQSIEQLSDPSETATNQFSFEQVEVTTSGTSVTTGTNMPSITAAVDGTNATLLNLSVTMAAGAYAGNFALFAICHNSTTTIQHNAVLIGIARAAAAVIDGDITIGTYPSSTNANKFNFNTHQTNAIASAWDGVRGYSGDLWICRARFANNQPSRSSISRIIMGIKRTGSGQVLESTLVPASSLPYAGSRQYPHSDSPAPDWGEISLVESASDTYDLIYAFRLLQAWEAMTDVVFFVQFSYAQNGIPTSDEFRSAAFEIAAYEEITNDVEPVSIELLNSSGTQNVSGIIDSDTATTLVRVNFETSDIFPNVGDMRGWLQIKATGAGDNLLRYIHSGYATESSSPWQNGTAQVVRVSDTEAYFEAEILGSQLANIFGAGNDYEIVGRIVDIDVLPPDFTWLSSTATLVSVATGGYRLTGNAIRKDGLPFLPGPSKSLTLTFDLGNSSVFEVELEYTANIADISTATVLSSTTTTLTRNDATTVASFGWNDIKAYISGTVTNGVINITLAKVTWHTSGNAKLYGDNAVLIGLDCFFTNASGDGSSDSAAYQLVAVYDAHTTAVEGGFTNASTSASLTQTTILDQAFAVDWGDGDKTYAYVPAGLVVLSHTYSSLANHDFVIYSQAATILSLTYATSNLRGTLDISAINNLQTNNSFNSNASLTSLLTGSSSQVITSFLTQSTGLTSLDLSGYPNMTGSLRGQSSALASLNLGTKLLSFTFFDYQNNQLTTVDFSNCATTLSANNARVNLSNNLLSSSAVDQILIDLDAATVGGFTGRTIQLQNQTPAAPPTVASAAALASLVLKGFTVTTD